MSNLLTAAINCVGNPGTIAFAKYLSANDTGVTGSHQSGIYIPKNSNKLLFDEPGIKGSNKEELAVITWNDALTTDSCFKYYGAGTRNEYRITCFGRNFEYLKKEHTGDLLIICRSAEDAYRAYVLSTGDEIEGFLEAFALSPTMLNTLISAVALTDSPNAEELFDTYLVDFGDAFPNTSVMSQSAIEADVLLNGDPAGLSPDTLILRRIDTEYRIFRHFEETLFSFVLKDAQTTVDKFIQVGLSFSNRRKSRAGSSLEHHLAAIFDEHGLEYTPQAITEGKKKPDFLFPSESAYQDMNFPSEKLIFLGAKTTCKDRWRQVLNEANRIPHKYLFTLQQSISADQLQEMHEENLTLVVPSEYHKQYPKTNFESVISLKEFIHRVSDMQK